MVPLLPELLLRSPEFLTACLPGTGGVIKREIEDFVVEEIPAYLPAGEGEHAFVWVEKRDMGGEYFQRQLAERLGIGPEEIGMAGIKDRRAVTRQWVSIPATAESRVGQLQGDGIKVLEVKRHGNKLRPGHLHGNRFTVLIREPVNPDAIGPIVEQVKALGLPNYYGTQRFGRDAETLRMGWTLLHGGRVQAGRFLRKLAFSAVQSACFNAYLSQRKQDGLLRSVIPGDVMVKWPAGGMFVTQDAPTEQTRFDQREIVHTGPMFGSKMRQPAGNALERESAVLQQLGLAADTFHAGGKLLEGTRRMNLIYVDDLQFSEEERGIRLRFSLPAGSYATTMLAEIMKTIGTADGD